MIAKRSFVDFLKLDFGAAGGYSKADEYSRILATN